MLETNIVVCKSFPDWFELLTSDEELAICLTLQEESKWEKIRARFLDSEYTGIHSTEFSRDQKNTVVYILLKFIRAVDRCTKAIVNKLEVIHISSIQDGAFVACFEKWSAWKEYCAENWLKEFQESIDRFTGRCNISKILLKTALTLSKTSPGFYVSTVQVF